MSSRTASVGLVLAACISIAIGAWALGDLREVRALGPGGDIADLPVGAEIHLLGSFVSRFDGTRFDAASRTNLRPNGTTQIEDTGFFDLEAGGLEVVSKDAARHDVLLRVRHAISPECGLRGLGSPCLLSRVGELARERLLTESEFRRTLDGDLHIADVSTVAPRAPAFAWSAFMGAAALLTAAGLVAVRAHRTTTAHVTRRLARHARARTSGDPTLALVHASVGDLVAQADGLESARDKALSTLAAIPPADQAVLRERASDTSSSEALRAAAAKELAELEQLRADTRAADAGIARVHAALRTISLAARQERGVRVAEVGDAAEGAFDALATRDEAARELELDAGRYRI